MNGQIMLCDKCGRDLGGIGWCPLCGFDRTAGPLKRMVMPMNVTFGCLTVLREMMIADDPICGAELTRALKIGSSTVYPMLARLKRCDWIELAGTLPHPSQPNSHFYRITPKGRAHFLDMLCRLTIPSDMWRDQPNGVADEYRKLRPTFGVMNGQDVSK